MNVCCTAIELEQTAKFNRRQAALTLTVPVNLSLFGTGGKEDTASIHSLIHHSCLYTYQCFRNLKHLPER